MTNEVNLHKLAVMAVTSIHETPPTFNAAVVVGIRGRRWGKKKKIRLAGGNSPLGEIVQETHEGVTALFDAAEILAYCAGNGIYTDLSRMDDNDFGNLVRHKSGGLYHLAPGMVYYEPFDSWFVSLTDANGQTYRREIPEAQYSAWEMSYTEVGVDDWLAEPEKFAPYVCAIIRTKNARVVGKLAEIRQWARASREEVFYLYACELLTEAKLHVQTEDMQKYASLKEDDVTAPLLDFVWTGDEELDL